MTIGQRFHAGGWRAFKVEVALNLTWLTIRDAG